MKVGAIRHLRQAEELTLEIFANSTSLSTSNDNRKARKPTYELFNLTIAMSKTVSSTKSRCFRKKWTEGRNSLFLFGNPNVRHDASVLQLVSILSFHSQPAWLKKG